MISSEAGSVTPCFLATSWISSGFPSSTQRAMPRSETMEAAATVRGSVPSGSTMRLFAARAASTSRWRKAGGESRGTRPGCGERLQPGRVDAVGDRGHHPLDPLGVVRRDLRGSCAATALAAG